MLSEWLQTASDCFDVAVAMAIRPWQSSKSHRLGTRPPHPPCLSSISIPIKYLQATLTPHRTPQYCISSGGWGNVASAARGAVLRALDTLLPIKRGQPISTCRGP